MPFLSTLQTRPRTFGSADANDVVIRAREIIVNNSSILTDVFGSESKGNGGDIIVSGDSLLVRDSGLLSASTSGIGNAGDISIEVADVEIIGDINRDRFNNTALVTAVLPGSVGRGGDISISSNNLRISAGGTLASSSLGLGVAGNVLVDSDEIIMNEGDISTSSFLGAGDGGNITVNAANFAIFLGDSDIIASSDDGKGGNITLSTPALFLDETSPASSVEANPDALDRNDRVDINARGATDGVVTLPTINFLESDLTSLPDNLVAADQLIADSCIARTTGGQGAFVVTGSGRIASSPDAVQPSSLPTGTVQSIVISQPSADENLPQGRDVETVIEEPAGIYRLADGRLIMSRDC